MNLLLINFEMNPASQVLSWQYRIVEELAKHCETVVVATENLACAPNKPNIHLYELSRTLRRFPMRNIGGHLLLNIPVWRLCRRHKIDACFIHMNHAWAYRLYPCFQSLNIPVLLWYAHGTVSWQLKLAHRCVTRVVSSTPEGFRIPSAKLHVIGQAIDTSLFKLIEQKEIQKEILTVSRISRRKRIDLIIQAFAQLIQSYPAIEFRLRIVGAPLTDDDQQYIKEINELVKQKHIEGSVFFEGHQPHFKIPAYYHAAFVHLNLSQTGSMDKTAMESLSCGCPLLTDNEAILATIKEYPDFILKDDNPKAIAQQLYLIYTNQKNYNREALRSVVEGKHDLASYVEKIMQHIKNIKEANKTFSIKRG